MPRYQPRHDSHQQQNGSGYRSQPYDRRERPSRYQRYPQESRQPPPTGPPKIPQVWTTLLAVENAETLAKAVDELSADWLRTQDQTLRGLKACITEFADRTPLFASLIASLIQRNSEAHGAIQNLLQQHFDNELASGNWRSVKLMIRLFGELAQLQMMNASDVLAVLSALSAVVSDSMSKSERKDLFSYLVLASLPWCAPVLMDADITMLLTPIQKYMSEGREKRIQASSSLKFMHANCPFEQHDSLALLWKQIEQGRATSWATQLIDRLPADDNMAAQENQLSIKNPTVPLDSPSLVYPLPRSFFTLYDGQMSVLRGNVVLNLPEVGTMDHFLLYDIVDDLIQVYETNHLEGTNHLVKVLPNCPYDQIQCIMDILMIHSLEASPPLKHCYYALLVMNLCRAKRDVVPPLLGTAIYTLFSKLDNLNAGVRMRFAQWMSWHISNFDYKWNWKEWSNLSFAPVENVNAQFVRDLLERCVHLSYFERVSKVLPSEPSMLPLMPVQPEPCFDYQTVFENGEKNAELEETLIALVDRLTDGMRLRYSVPDMKQILHDIAAYGVTKGYGKASEEEPAGMSLSREIFLQCILHHGSKSFSHILNITERYLPLLHYVSSSDQAKFEVIRIVQKFWVKNRQMMMIVLDKFINYKILEPTTVVNWLFSPEGAFVDCNKSYFWDILYKTVAKVNTRVDQINKRLEGLKRSVNRDQSQMEDSTLPDDPVDHPNPSQDKQNRLLSMQATMDRLSRDHKQLFIHIYEAFVRVLTDSQLTGDKRQWCLDMMADFGLCFHEDLRKYATTLEMMVFTGPKVDPQLKSVFMGTRQLHG